MLIVLTGRLCWTAINPGYQGEGLIDGPYFDYVVNDIVINKLVQTQETGIEHHTYNMQIATVCSLHP